MDAFAWQEFALGHVPGSRLLVASQGDGSDLGGTVAAVIIKLIAFRKYGELSLLGCWYIPGVKSHNILFVLIC